VNVSKKTAVSILGAAMACACMGSPVFALNGNTFVTSCGCVTSADFAGQALNIAADQSHPVLVTVVSTTQAKTALIRVTGRFITGSDGEPRWTATTTTPVDAAGNSMAGQLEADLQSFFTVLDLETFGVSRSYPILLPGQYAYFGVVSDQQMSDSINADLDGHTIMGADVIITTGMIEVTFVNGDKAQYVEMPKGSKNWVWNGFAYNSRGHRIGRDGLEISNPNTGGQGGGSYSGHGFGTGATSSFDMSASGSCQQATTITVNGELTSYVFIAPC
jgi:hypothetical protein